MTRPAAPASVGVGKRLAPARFLLFGGAFVVVMAAAAALGAELSIALVVGFDAAALAFLVATTPLLGASAAAMRQVAERNDANRLALLSISVLLSLVILVAVGTLIARPTSLRGDEVALIVVTLLLAWLFANSVFTLHYAYLYYLQTGGRDRGGLEMPGARGPEPDYWDFLYFSFTLGMTFQTSDVAITDAHMRRIALLHAMAAFLFNMGILAFTVNALGGL